MMELAFHHALVTLLLLCGPAVITAEHGIRLNLGSGTKVRTPPFAFRLHPFFHLFSHSTAHGWIRKRG